MYDLLTRPEQRTGRAWIGAALSAPAAPEVAAALARLDADPRPAGPGEPIPGATLWADLVPIFGAPAAAHPALAEAAAAMADGRFAAAVTQLVPLAGDSAFRAEALVGLAICAARLGRPDEALILALEGRRLAPEQPRAHCVAGLCALQRGHRRAAQGHLAAAARLARRDPAHAADLRLSQRALLLMHLG